MRSLLFALAVFALGFTLTSAQAQSEGAFRWEYESYPDLPFTMDHLVLNLTVNPAQALIGGIARYDLSSKRNNLTQVVFHTADVAIQSVRRGGEDLEYRASGDSLIIQLADTLAQNEKTQFHITWQSQSDFGIHSDGQGNIWTSQNPTSLHHWFPVYDHPRIVSTVDAYITLPANYLAVFSGDLVEDQVVSAEHKKLHWKSGKEIPVTGLGLVVGQFSKEEVISGVKRVRLYTGEGTVLDEVRTGLLQTAVSTLKSMEEQLSFEYPYEALNVVVLPDSYWQEKQAGAGIVYLYQDLGSLSHQLKRGIAAQWFGQYHRSSSFLNEVKAFEFLKTSMSHSVNTGILRNPDSLISVKKWNYWQQAYPVMEEKTFRETVEQTLPDLVKSFSGMVDEDDYAKFWYERSGSYWNQLPEIDLNKQNRDTVQNYAVNYIYDEMSADLELVFQAEREGVASLVGVALTEYGFSDSTRHTLSFTGTVDTVLVELSSGVEYVTLQQLDGPEVRFRENKPFYFLLNQLRSSVPDLRAQAASALAAYSNNPDLQLALMDIIRTEEHPKVKAAAFCTLAEVTQGASGTEQVFLDALNSDAEAIKLSAIRALDHYEGNENVIYAIRSQLVQTESDSVFKYALQTLQHIAEPSQLVSLAERFQRSDSTGIKTLKVLEVAAPVDTSGTVFEITESFIVDNYPHLLREKALQILVENQDTPEFWVQRIKGLLSDPDPRIRYLSLDALKYLGQESRVEILSSRAKEEFDPRVLRKVHLLQD